MGRLARFIRFFTGEDQRTPPIPVSWKTVTGNAPLTLNDAAAHKIKRLVQYGNCEQSGSSILCNNGTLKIVDDELPIGYKRITGMRFDGNVWFDTGEVLSGDDDVTMTLANTSTTGQNVFGSYNGTSSGKKNFSLYVYGGNSTSNTYFRYGEQLVRPRYGSGERTITFGKSGTSGFTTDVTVTPDEFTTEATAYIGMLPNSSSPAYTGSIIGNILVGTRLKYVPCIRESDGEIGYYEMVKGVFIEPIGTGTLTAGSDDLTHVHVEVIGTAEVLTIGTQTAHVANLFAVGSVKDEHDLISGIVTRKTEVVVSNGEIVVQALATPVVEHVGAQRLYTAEGTNTVTVTAVTSAVPLEVEYAQPDE